MVYELDTDPHGAEIQEALGKLTGRRTVPNVFVCRQSIGGGSEVAALGDNGVLVETLLTKCPSENLIVDGHTR